MLDQNERDLRDYQSKVDAEDAYAEALEEKTAELMKKGEDYYPFALHNFDEALREADTSSMSKLAIMVQVAEESESIDLCTNAYVQMVSMVTDYWQKLASDRAYDLFEEMKNEVE